MQTLKPRTDSAHYYDFDGTPKHTILGKTTGRPRPTTITDAKREGWVPSVTTVLRGGLPTPYGLELWRLRMLLDHALTTERQQDEDDENFIRRIQADYDAAKSKAPDLGTEVHQQIADYLLRGETLGSGDSFRIFQQAKRWIGENAYSIVAVEHTAVNHREGYAGTIDFVFLNEDGERCIVDWKTQEPKRGKVKVREDWVYQLAAYEEAYCEDLHPTNCMNVILPTDGSEPVVKVWGVDELEHGWQVFWSALRTYYLVNKWG